LTFRLVALKRSCLVALNQGLLDAQRHQGLPTREALWG